MQFLTPGGAWALLGAAVIIALYMLRQQYEERIVPSTFLWRRAMADQSANRPFQRLKKSILLILQLLIALLLALALMHPATKGASAGDYAFIFDVSASMQADGRMERARAQALKRLEAMPAGSTVALIAAGSETQTLLARTEDLAQAAQVVRGITAGYAGANVDQAVSLGRAMQRETEGMRIIVFSDSYEGPEDIEVCGVGGGADNRAILSVNLSLGEERADAVARVANYGAAAEITMEIYADGALWDVHTLALPEGETGSVRVSLPARTEEVRARLAQADALMADNEMYAVAASARTYTVACAGEENVFLDTALKLREDIALVRTGTEDLSSVPAELRVLDADGALWFSAGNASEISLGEAREGSGTLRAADNAVARILMQNVSLDGVAVKTFRPLEGGTPVLLCGEETLVAWEEGSIVFGFDIHDSNLPVKPGFPVLIQNVLAVLLPEVSTQVTDCICGDIIEVNTSARTVEAWVETPEGEKLVMPCRAETPGIYRLVQRMEDGGQSQTPFVVRMAGEESDVRGVTSDSERSEESDVRAAGREWMPALVALAVALSLLEWWVSRRGY